jgi:hypothetical protein
MKYNILPQKDTQSFTSDDSEKDHFYSSHRRLSLSTATLLALSSASLVLLVLLLSLSALRDSSKCPVQASGWNVTRPYGRANSSRMSLDHEHDDLWSVFEPLPAFGGMYKENPDTAGMISMYVHAGND